MTLNELRESNAATISLKLGAEVAGVDPRTLSEGIRQGNIPAIRIGRRWVIPREKFLALFEVIPVDE